MKNKHIGSNFDDFLKEESLLEGVSAKARLANVDKSLQQKLKDKEFRRLYEIEQAKVALAQKTAKKRR